MPTELERHTVTISSVLEKALRAKYPECDGMKGSHMLRYVVATATGMDKADAMNLARNLPRGRTARQPKWE